MRRDKSSPSSDHHEIKAPGFNPLLRATYLMMIRTVCDQESLRHFFPVRLDLIISYSSSIGLEEYQKMLDRSRDAVCNKLEIQAIEILKPPSMLGDSDNFNDRLKLLKNNIIIHQAERAKKILEDANYWQADKKNKSKIRYKLPPALK